MVCARYFSYDTLGIFANVIVDILDIEGLEEPSIVKNAIDRLVMDPMDKETIKAIAKTYTENDQGTEFFSADFINGKGEGQILLLHGPPGTGKTLTAGNTYTNTF